MANKYTGKGKSYTNVSHKDTKLLKNYQTKSNISKDDPVCFKYVNLF